MAGNAQDDDEAEPETETEGEDEDGGARHPDESETEGEGETEEETDDEDEFDYEDDYDYEDGGEEGITDSYADPLPFHPTFVRMGSIPPKSAPRNIIQPDRRRGSTPAAPSRDTPLPPLAPAYAYTTPIKQHSFWQPSQPEPKPSRENLRGVPGPSFGPGLNVAPPRPVPSPSSQSNQPIQPALRRRQSSHTQTQGALPTALTDAQAREQAALREAERQWEPLEAARTRTIG
ncbi:hypothetical protein EW145_g8654, partial [Phellinidium pouzarii]